MKNDFPKHSKSVESFIISIPRDTPYLGALGPGERINERGYLVRHGNRSDLPRHRHVGAHQGHRERRTVGWGETYGMVAPMRSPPSLTSSGPGDPRARSARRRRHPRRPLRRDARARLLRRPLPRRDRRRRHRDVGPVRQADRPAECKLLGGQRTDRIPATCPGLPKATLATRQLARDWVARLLELSSTPRSWRTRAR